MQFWCNPFLFPIEWFFFILPFLKISKYVYSVSCRLSYVHFSHPETYSKLNDKYAV